MEMKISGHSAVRLGLGAYLLPVMGMSVIDSTPPATATSTWPVITSCAAVAMACRPEEQKRLMVWPEGGESAGARVLGRPPRRLADGRAHGRDDHRLSHRRDSFGFARTFLLRCPQLRNGFPVCRGCRMRS